MIALTCARCGRREDLPESGDDGLGYARTWGWRIKEYPSLGDGLAHCRCIDCRIALGEFLEELAHVEHPIEAEEGWLGGTDFDSDDPGGWAR